MGHDELKYYNLILVYSKVYDNVPQKKIYRIKTLHPDDIIVDVLGTPSITSNSSSLTHTLPIQAMSLTGNQKGDTSTRTATINI